MQSPNTANRPVSNSRSQNNSVKQGLMEEFVRVFNMNQYDSHEIALVAGIAKKLASQNVYYDSSPFAKAH